MTKPIDQSATRDELLTHLNAHKIAHKTHEHKAVFTVEESREIKAHLPGAHTKNLFLKSKDGALYLLCALAETKIPVNHLHKTLGCKRLSFGKPELLEMTLGIKPGSVCLFALINDTERKVKLLLDQALMGFDVVNFHPLFNTATTTISCVNMERFAKSTGHEPLFIDFAKMTEQ